LEQPDIVDSLRALYGKVLGRSSVEKDDDFFADLNGDSLGAAVVVVTIEHTFGIRILEDFFKDSTPSAVGHRIDERLRERALERPAKTIEETLDDSAFASDVTRLLESLHENRPPAVAPETPNG